MKKLALVLFTVTMLAGCLVMVPGHLYPVEGALSAKTPVPIYKVTLNGVLNSGSMSATLPDGEVCSGNWTAVPQNDPSAGQLSVEWDRVYGEGFFVANILGNPDFARAILVGAKGTTLNVEFFAPMPGQMIGAKGVATDNHGNVFKLAF